jgi:hypothetical protein
MFNGFRLPDHPIFVAKVFDTQNVLVAIPVRDEREKREP